jgi:hypothetical protein
MKASTFLLAALLFGVILPASAQAKEFVELKVLYVGSKRAPEYVDFLKGKVAQVEAKAPADFKMKDAAAFDVVLLDWPQGADTREMRKLTSPLGLRDEWNKPTVLLGSAGLNLAVVWKMKGGCGCTCMAPLAFDLRDNEVFRQPFKIDQSKTISIPTPPDFQAEIKEHEIKVLPLVDHYQRDWAAGWCSYSNDFARNPDVEIFCGGVNHKTPTAAGLWRQGNLLHFSFEQSPTEMNESGQMLLLNAIAYISHFSEDRPIAITPSVFAGPAARFRSTPARWLRNPEFPVDAVKDLVAAEIWETLSALPNRERMAEWAAANAKVFHPNNDQKLEINEDLVAFDVSFDQAEFFEKTFAALRSNDTATVARARRLLARYVPTGPKVGGVDVWIAWWKENQPYAFACDEGDYRWYIDPLAKKRGVPTSDLRGSKRADLTSPLVTASH